MSVVTVTILSAGAAIPETIEVMALDIRRELDRIPRASLTMLERVDLANTAFETSDGAWFEPGRKIEIKLRHEDDSAAEATVFEGVVVRHAIEMDTRGALLKVELRDEAVKLTRPRRSAVFKDMSDSDVIAKLVNAAGLKAGTIESTEPAHKSLVQYDCTDWDFIVSRADVMGLVVVAADGTLSAKAPGGAGAPKFELQFGRDEVYDFEFEADAGHQNGDLSASAWDPKSQKTQDSAAQAPAAALGNLDGSNLAGLIGFAPGVMRSMVPLEPKELKAWADASMARNRMALVRGRISTIGRGDVALLDTVALIGIGERFAGDGLVTALRHRVDASGWRLDLQFGLSPRSFSEGDDILQAPAAGLLPAASGVQVGIVDAVAEDPDKEFRIAVVLPLLGPDQAPLWARLSTPYAGAGHGQMFRPEVGDEVVVGFFNQDPRHPVILGSLYSSKNAPPDALAQDDKENKAKGIVTASGIKMLWKEGDKPTLSFELPSGAKLSLDDDKESILISDKHGNTIVLDKGGIAIVSGKDFKVDAGSGNVEIAGSQVDLK
jgi:Rhs element Vgr protein